MPGLNNKTRDIISGAIDIIFYVTTLISSYQTSIVLISAYELKSAKCRNTTSHYRVLNAIAIETVV